MITLEQKKQLQFDARTPHLPTDLTYECRMAISGEGERAFDWRDKPHRLVYDLSRQVEADANRIRELKEQVEQWKAGFALADAKWGKVLMERDKAVKALREISGKTSFSDDAWYTARTTLADLEGG